MNELQKMCGHGRSDARRNGEEFLGPAMPPKISAARPHYQRLPPAACFLPIVTSDIEYSMQPASFAACQKIASCIGLVPKSLPTEPPPPIDCGISLRCAGLQVQAWTVPWILVLAGIYPIRTTGPSCCRLPGRALWLDLQRISDRRFTAYKILASIRGESLVACHAASIAHASQQEQAIHHEISLSLLVLTGR